MKTMIKTVFAGWAAAWTLVAPCVDLSAGQVVFGTGNVARDCCALSDVAQQDELLVLMKDRCPNPICAIDQTLYLNDASAELCVLFGTNSVHCCVMTEDGGVFSREYPLSPSERDSVPMACNSFFYASVYPRGMASTSPPRMTMTVFGKDVKCHKSFYVPRSGCGISEILHYSTDVVEQVLKEDSEKAFSAICANNGLLEFFVMASKYITMFVDVCEEDGFRPHILHGKRFAGIPGRTESLDERIRAVAGLVDEIACYGVGASSLELSADETDGSVRYRVRAGAEVSFGIDVMKENGLVYLHLPGTIDIGSFLAHGM